MEFYFDHEKLEVYQVAIQFVAWSENLLEECQGKAASAKKHLDEASSSIPNNIAEGNGKWSKKDRKKFFEVARGSALECASCLDVLVALAAHQRRSRHRRKGKTPQHREPVDADD
jgi:four helix bundle protein